MMMYIIVIIIIIIITKLGVNAPTEVCQKRFSLLTLSPAGRNEPIVTANESFSMHALHTCNSVI